MIRSLANRNAFYRLAFQLARHQFVYVCCAFVVLLVNCSSDNKAAGHEPRPKDPVPEKIQLARPLPQGVVEAFFTLNTGSDQMLQKPKEAGLVLVVRIEGIEYRQTIASCSDPGLGSALGGGTPRELEVAICNGEYWLITEPGVLNVLRVDKKPDSEVIARFDLPKKVTATSPANK